MSPNYRLNVALKETFWILKCGTTYASLFGRIKMGFFEAVEELCATAEPLGEAAPGLKATRDVIDSILKFLKEYTESGTE
jgi:hypothetical protein